MAKVHGPLCPHETGSSGRPSITTLQWLAKAAAGMTRLQAEAILGCAVEANGKLLACTGGNQGNTQPLKWAVDSRLENCTSCRHASTGCSDAWGANTKHRDATAGRGTISCKQPKIHESAGALLTLRSCEPQRGGPQLGCVPCCRTLLVTALLLAALRPTALVLLLLAAAFLRRPLLLLCSGSSAAAGLAAAPHMLEEVVCAQFGR